MVDLALTDDILVESPLEAAIQELDILFNTLPTELLGSYNYGTNFLQFLWALTPMEEPLAKYINEIISLYTGYVTMFSPTVNVVKYDGVNENVYSVEITLHDNNGEEHIRTYTVSE